MWDCAYGGAEMHEALLRLRRLQVKEGREASGKEGPEVSSAEAGRGCPAFHSLAVLSQRPCVFHILQFLKPDNITA